MMLSQLLASMKDSDGNVVIDGFYDSVDPLGEQERAALATVPEVDDALRHEMGIGWTEGGGATLAERLLLPSLNVRGLSSANVGDDARNVIPPTATAAIDIRLVKGNDPVHMQGLVEAHVAAQGYHVVRENPDMATRRSHERIAKITRGKGYRAARTRMDHPIVTPLTTAARLAAGGSIIQMPSLGGSLPLYLFNEKLGATVVIVPVANHDNNQHAANENLRVANLWYGIDLMAAILTME
jgi:acetylornithine deacetylase/succinyl-diaminopimelate desuccinylase-like protein